MISKADNQDFLQIHMLWKEIFRNDDHGSTDYYFNNCYDKNNVYVKKNGEEVVASAMRSPFTIKLHDNFIKTSLILGVLTKENYRNQGYMKEIFNVIDDSVKHQELITLIQAYNPNLYRQFGFEVVYFRKRFNLSYADIHKVDTNNIIEEFDARACLKAYVTFCKRFTGFKVRDLSYYYSYHKEVLAQNGNIIAVQSNGHTSGYLVYFQRSGKIIIEEAIYHDALSLMKMLRFLLKYDMNIELNVSSAELLGKLFPNAEVENYQYMMARINDIELFNRLYNCNIKDTVSGFNLYKKPLYISEWK